jgi:hypothetical protein
VDSERYCTMLQTFLATELWRMRQRVRNVWFHQDGATANTARKSMTFLRGMFPGHLISLFGDIPSFSHSLFPDFTAPDFFLWGISSLKCMLLHPRTERPYFVGNWNNQWCFIGASYAELQTAITTMYRMSWRSSGTSNLQETMYGY